MKGGVSLKRESWPYNSAYIPDLGWNLRGFDARRSVHAFYTGKLALSLFQIGVHSERTVLKHQLTKGKI